MAVVAAHEARRGKLRHSMVDLHKVARHFPFLVPPQGRDRGRGSGDGAGSPSSRTRLLQAPATAGVALPQLR